MTPNRRIALNIAATYGRSLFSLVCGLFTGRWLLMALGTTNYGLYGLIGGLALFISFFNELLATAVERFFAFAVGKEKGEECQRWFSVAAGLHGILAVVLVGVGYPVGAWAIRHYLNIPVDRVEDCVWVFRFVCLNCLVTMATLPCAAMYRAKQLIAELTVYSVIQTAANVAVLGYAVTHPGDWLVRYAGCWCVIIVLPALCIALRALTKFPECRIRIAYAWDLRRIVRLVDFMASRFICMLGIVMSEQGLAVVVNRYLGVARNAALTVSTSVSTSIMTMSGSVAGAFMPAITNAAGAGELGKMRDYAYRTCLLATLMVLVVAVPLSLEIDEVLKLWLVTPPDGAAGLCLCVLAMAVVERLSDGHWMSIFALGNIRRFQLGEAVTFFGAFALGWILVAYGSGVLGVGLAVLAGRLANLFVKLWFGCRLADLSVRLWIWRAFLPVVGLAAVSLAAGAVPRLTMDESLVRCAVTACASVGVLALFAFRLVKREMAWR